jgi:hypothetical protein
MLFITVTLKAEAALNRTHDPIAGFLADADAAAVPGDPGLCMGVGDS